MPQVLTTNAVVTCPHGGVGTTIPSTPVWSVQGGMVCGESDAGTLACPFVVPCVGYTLRSMGLNATTVMDRRVILVTDFQQTLTGLPLTIVETHRVIDDSTPAAIPAGASAPPLSPAMQDSTPPVVVAAPPAAAFSTMTMLPPMLPVIFTLSHPFPLRWILTLINGTTGLNMDVTTGLPPALTVLPAGGEWTSPALVITATMTAAFLAGLAPGVHYLYMTGVSQRGISAYATVTITVS